MYIFAIPASTAINIVAITIENILTLLNAEIIELVTKARDCTAFLCNETNEYRKRGHHKFVV